MLSLPDRFVDLTIYDLGWPVPLEADAEERILHPAPVLALRGPVPSRHEGAARSAPPERSPCH